MKKPYMKPCYDISDYLQEIMNEQTSEVMQVKKPKKYRYFSKEICKRFTEAVGEAIANALLEEKCVSIRNLGTFYLAVYPERTIHVLDTKKGEWGSKKGGIKTLPAFYRVKFIPTPQFKNVLKVLEVAKNDDNKGCEQDDN